LLLVRAIFPTETLAQWIVNVDSIWIVLKIMATNTNKFSLTFYGTTMDFSYNSEKEAVLNFIKDLKGKGGAFLTILKGGEREPFLGNIFVKKEDIHGYEFLPQDLTTSVQPGPTGKFAGCHSSLREIIN
jgi:hypothetical protein